MADRFMHPTGRKAQNVRLRGKRLVRLTDETPNNNQRKEAEGIAEKRRRKQEEAAGRMGSQVGEQKGVSGYLKPKEKTLEELEKAFQ